MDSQISQINKPALKMIIRKTMKTFSWIIGVSFIISLLMGGIVAYGVPYQGLDMPIYLPSNEEINWSAILIEEDKAFDVKDELQMNDKSLIKEAVLGYLGQGGSIGRDPPKDEINAHLVKFNRLVRISINMKSFPIANVGTWSMSWREEKAVLSKK